MSTKPDIIETLRYLQKTNEFGSVGSEAVDAAIAEIVRLRQEKEDAFTEGYGCGANSITPA